MLFCSHNCYFEDMDVLMNTIFALLPPSDVASIRCHILIQMPHINSECQTCRRRKSYKALSVWSLGWVMYDDHLRSYSNNECKLGLQVIHENMHMWIIHSFTTIATNFCLQMNYSFAMCQRQKTGEMLQNWFCNSKDTVSRKSYNMWLNTP